MPWRQGKYLDDDQKYKIRRWLDFDLNEWDLQVLDRHPYLLEWEPATMYDGTRRPHPKTRGNTEE